MTAEPVHSRESAAGAEGAGGSDVETARLLPVLVPVTLGGIAVLTAGIWSFTTGGVTATLVAGVVALLFASVFSEAFPVPLEALPGGHVAMSAVFIVGAAVLYGWAAAILVAVFTRAALEIVQRRPPVKLAYNSSVYGLSGAAAGVVASMFAGMHGVYFLFLEVPLCAAAYYTVNIPLVAAIVARWAREPFLPLLRRWVAWTAVPSAIMASVSLMLAALWQQTPALAAALVGPMVAIALYQRSVHSALKAMRLALSDPLTGLGNHRHFHERLQVELDGAEATGRPLTLCLIDIDDFKRINDTYGHPTGDDVLGQVAGCLRHGGEAFRLGGDEFALVLPARSEEDGVVVAEAVASRLEAIECRPGERISISVGLATYPQHGVERSELMRVADSALYVAKGAGKNQVRAYRPGLRAATG